MKPNLLVIQPNHPDADPAIERFCEALCDTHYVYVVRPETRRREDSPAGVRFLNYSPDGFPGFGMLESILIVDGPEIADDLKERYPTARQWHWNRSAEGEFHPHSIPSLSNAIVRGEFGRDEAEPFARAM